MYKVVWLGRKGKPARQIGKRVHKKYSLYTKDCWGVNCADSESRWNGRRRMLPGGDGDDIDGDSDGDGLDLIYSYLVSHGDHDDRDNYHDKRDGSKATFSSYELQI